MIILRQPVKDAFITQEWAKDFKWSNPNKGVIEWFYRDTFGLQGHPGIDYRAPIGTPIYSAHDGVCLSANFSDVNGNMVQIWNEKEGYKTVYGHNSEMKVKQGDAIKAGQLIALSGNTGTSTAAHLHFGLMLTIDGGNRAEPNNGFNGAIDPTPYIKLDYLGNKIKDMIFRQIKGDKNVYLVDDIKGTKMMIVDMPTLEALDGQIQEVSDLAGYIDKGTLIWCERIIN